MLDAAAFPITSQIAFLTFFHERVIGMLGPLESLGSKSYMTFDGSPVELSWVIPSNVKPGAGVTGRQVRFAIEPIDPETGELLAGVEVLKYFTSREGGLGLVKSDMGVLDWSVIADEFLYSKEDQRRFFVGFDFSRTGEITLKTYYIPLARPSNPSSKSHLWDVDYTPLRSLITTLDASLMDSLDMITSFSEEVDPQYKPRLQILSMDCVPNEVNRLKMYCRPSYGTSWTDARRAFTLGGKLDCPKMDRALEHLETLWNLLFPFAASHSNRQLEEGLELATHGNTCERRSPDHPTGGLLFYYSLVPGSGMILPKIYLPVSRYCPNDEFISGALEKFYALNGGELQERGWVSREVSSAYNHRPLREKCGIFTYVTFALKKNYKWEVTNYFSPEVWE
ncbi:hypothetical protein H0H93_010303 [Arthromyces matolae]|nr:hypothetical protein H0H93_010303 [Arthromyces matolae]